MNQPTVRAFFLGGLALVCLAIFIAGTLVTPPYEPMPLDPFWLVWAGFPVVGALIFAGAALVSAIARYRRADAIGRLQVKWVIVPAPRVRP